jgi:hypothetical protein
MVGQAWDKAGQTENPDVVVAVAGRAAIAAMFAIVVSERNARFDRRTPSIRRSPVVDAGALARQRREHLVRCSRVIMRPCSRTNHAHTTLLS